MDAIPISLLFAGTVIVVMLAIEAGYRLGSSAHKRAVAEKESPVSAISASILALLAFILAFTFGIVSNRYDAKKALVREEANAIGTAYLRSDFLAEPDRARTATLFREYVSQRLAAVQAWSSVTSCWVRPWSPAAPTRSTRLRSAKRTP